MSVKKYNTIFSDIDGTILKYRSFNTYLTSEPEPIQNVVNKLNECYDRGDTIVLTSARPQELYDHTVNEMKKIGLKFHKIVLGLARGTRYLINDMEDPTKQRAISINIIRDEGFTKDDCDLLK